MTFEITYSNYVDNALTYAFSYKYNSSVGTRKCGNTGAKYRNLGV